MRPKKEIIVHCDREPRGGVLRMMLRTRGFLVTEGFPADGGSDADVALLVDSGSHSDFALIQEFSALNPGVPLVVIFSPLRTSLADCAHVWLQHDASHEQILSHIRLITQRKRGPKAKAPAVEAGNKTKGAYVLLIVAGETRPTTVFNTHRMKPEEASRFTAFIKIAIDNYRRGTESQVVA